jgi:hypothetical protein
MYATRARARPSRPRRALTRHVWPHAQATHALERLEHMRLSQVWCSDSYLPRMHGSSEAPRCLLVVPD